MGMNRYRLRRGSLLILLLSLSLGSVIQGIALSRLSTHNETIERLVQGEDLPVAADAPPEVLFARAYWFRQKNRDDEAIELFNRLEGVGDPGLRARVRYNLADLYLARAIELTERSDFERAFTLASLAKDLYRESLRLDSQEWDVKYNLEVAMRLVPGLPQVETDISEKQHQQGFWSSIPGFPRGLP